MINHQYFTYNAFSSFPSNIVNIALKRTENIEIKLIYQMPDGDVYIFLYETFSNINKL